MRTSKRNYNPPIFLLLAFSGGSSVVILFVRMIVTAKVLLNFSLILTSFSFRASARLCFVIMAFPSLLHIFIFEREHSISHKIAGVTSEDSGKPAHPHILIRTFVIR